nr:CorA family divalent cation transporter [Pontibacter vulgaris]
MATNEAAGWIWLDVEDPTAEELQQVAEKYGLHSSSVKDCLEPHHLPKYEVINNIVFMITRVYDTSAHIDADTIQELTNKIAIFYTEGFIITIHRHPIELLLEIKQKHIDAGMLKSTSELLVKIIKASLRTFEAPAQRLAIEIDYYEEKIFLHSSTAPLTKGLYHVKRKAGVSRRILRLTEVILDSINLTLPQNPDLQDMLDLHLHVSTLYDEILDSINNLINIYISLSSNKTNEVMRVLTIFSVFFMPLTFIAGIYGMNFDFMPELHTKYGYPFIMLLMAVVTASIYYWFRKKRWL